MKKRLISILCLIAMLLSLCGTSVYAESDNNSVWSGLCAYGEAENENTKISTQVVDGKTYLFLPSNISPEAVTFGVGSSSVVYTVSGSKNISFELKDGSTINLTELCNETDNYKLIFKAMTASGVKSSLEVTVVCSSNVAAMYLVSSDPVNEGREWIESSKDKTNQTTGKMVMQDADGTLVYDSTLSQIKGRGNTTWNLAKRPYQIKLDNKTDLLQTGEKSNKAKAWVLLANYNDQSLLRNTIALNLGYEMGMEYSVENRAVDLYYDGEYRGSYLLTEKVQINKGRINITDLEELNDEANPGVDLETLSVATAKTANGATYTYCEGMVSPADITGGYLLEMEASYRTASEVCYFKTTRSNYVVVKSPEYASKDEMDYIASLYQEYEDALYSSDGINPTTGKSYSDYVDLKSTAQCYIINEFSKNIDGFRTSAYLYKDTGNDIMKMGPLWDYDLTFGVPSGTAANAAHQVEPTGWYTTRSVFAGRLYTMADFRLAVKDEYLNTVCPLVNILLGDESAVGNAGKLHSLAWYRCEMVGTAGSDFVLWRSSYNPTGDWSAKIDELESYLKTRSEWLKDAFTAWNADSYEPISSYLDVDTSNWYFEYVQDATKYSLMQGMGMSFFYPDTYTTRAQVIKVIFGMSGDIEVNYKQHFSDVKSGAWYAGPVTWGADKKIVDGYPDGTFKPDDNITRQDLVVMLYRYAGSPSVSGDKISSFSDAGKVSSYAKNAMEWAVESGIISGYPDGTIKPFGITNRAELAKITSVYYQNFVLNTSKDL